MLLVGLKTVTRGVKFSLDELSASEFESNQFVRALYEFLVEKFSNNTLSRSQSSGDGRDLDYVNLADRARDVEDYICDHEADIYDSFVGEMYRFIDSRKITHYINSINLGAAVYYESTVVKSSLDIGGNAGATADEVGLTALVNRNKDKGCFSTKLQSIGRLDEANQVLQEAIIDFEILPIYTLLKRRHVKTRKALEVALKLYIERESKYHKPSHST